MRGVFLVNFLLTLVTVQGFVNESHYFSNIVQILDSATFNGVSKLCEEHLIEYFRGIKENEQWAARMTDSITKFPDGVLIGHIKIPGHFDECVSAVHEKELFKGKHCIVKMVIEMTDKTRIISLPQQRDGKPHMLFFYGICIPSTCSATDIINFKKEIEPLNFIDIDFNDNDCSTDEFRPLRVEDWITICIIIGMAIIAVASTMYHYAQINLYKNDNPNQLLSSFSLVKNLEMLFKISQSSAQLKCLHGIRFLSMSWVILGHAYFSFLYAAPVNFLDIGKFLKERSFVPISNAFVSVDSFFFLSGLLVCIVFFRDIAKKKSFDVPVAFIHRYIRLTPPFALLMLIEATVISRIGNGPFWNQRVDEVEKNCRESWWTGLLYIQNFAKPTLMCLGQSWYLSADMQMFWISPLILYPVLWFPAYASFFILFLILAAVSTSFTVSFVNGLYPNFSFNLGPDAMKQFELEYVPFYTRLAPWLIGLGTGYIICGLQAKKIRFNLPNYLVWIGWLATFGLLGGSLFTITTFFDSDYTQVEASLYLSLHRVGWALGLSWVVIACVSGNGGPINSFLSWDAFQPLAKLSYCNFLVHMTIQNYRINTARTNQYLRHFDIVHSYFGDLLISNLISIPLVLLFEFPFTHIDRHFFQKLEIFPYPRPKNKVEKKAEDVEVIEKEEIQHNNSLENVEKGNVNPTFAES